MTGLSQKNTTDLQSQLRLCAYNRAHGEYVNDLDESSRAYTRALGILDGLQFSGKTTARTEAGKYFREETEHFRQSFNFA